MQVSLQGNTQGRQYYPTYTITEILPGQINLQYIIPDRQVYLSQREMLLIICLPVLQNGTAPFSTPCFFTYPFCSLDWSSQGLCLLMTTSFWMSIIASRHPCSPSLLVIRSESQRARTLVNLTVEDGHIHDSRGDQLFGSAAEMSLWAC